MFKFEGKRTKSLYLWNFKFLPHLNASRKKALLENALQTGEFWQLLLGVMVWTESISKKELLEKRWRHDSHVIASFPQNANPKLPACSVNGKHLMPFQCENVVFKFLQDSVDGPLRTLTNNKRHRQPSQCGYLLFWYYHNYTRNNFLSDKSKAYFEKRYCSRFCI